MAALIRKLPVPLRRKPKPIYTRLNKATAKEVRYQIVYIPSVQLKLIQFLNIVLGFVKMVDDSYYIALYKINDFKIARLLLMRSKQIFSLEILSFWWTVLFLLDEINKMKRNNCSFINIWITNKRHRFIVYDTVIKLLVLLVQVGVVTLHTKRLPFLIEKPTLIL